MSAAKRGSSGLAGVLLVDKPAGLTSHDVVARIRRLAAEKRVGHAGTLDPAATGLLVVLVGPYTRLEPYLSMATKSYDARFEFGSETDTDDAEGCTVRTAEVPDEVLVEASARAALAALLGESMQKPPAYSAIKVGGQTSHRVARAGGDLDLALRPVRVDRANLSRIVEVPPSWDVELVVSKGTYVRALARDIGRAMGSCAHLSALRRTASGVFRIEDAVTLDEIADVTATRGIASLFTDPIPALGYPVIEADIAAVTAGRPVPAPAGEALPERFSVVASGRLVAVYRQAGGQMLRAEAVFPVGEVAAQ